MAVIFHIKTNIHINHFLVNEFREQVSVVGCGAVERRALPCYQPGPGLEQLSLGLSLAPGRPSASPVALTHAGPAVALVLPLPWHTLLGSDESPRTHPKAETACGAGLGAAFYQGMSGSTEVNQVQVHFSNMCKLLSITAKSKLSGEETPVFLYCFSPLSPHTCPSIPSSQPASQLFQ